MSMNQPQVPFGVPVNPIPQKSGKGLFIGCVIGAIALGLVIGLIFGRSFGVDAVTKKAYPHLHTTADSTVSKRDISARYIDPKETAFDWDISDLGGLKFATYDDKGDAMSIEEVVKKYGKALKGTFNGTTAQLEWGELERDDADEESTDYKTASEMNLTFMKIDGHYYLRNLYFSEDYDTADANPMVADHYDKLKAGDPKTGKDGVSYKEVLSSNIPSYISIRAEQDYKTKVITNEMEIRFKSSSSDEDEYKLKFIQQADGDYRLALKGDAD